MTPQRRPLTFASSLIGSSLVLVGCLADPPEYEAPARVPPVVAYSQVEPDLSRIVRLDPGVDRLQVTVPFRSEDLGSPVVGAFFLDAEAGRRNVNSLTIVVVGPSVFEDEGRTIFGEVSGFAQQDPGCHSLTLMLTQRSNTSGFEVDALEQAEATRITWWLLLPDGDDDSVLLNDCPVVTLDD